MSKSFYSLILFYMQSGQQYNSCIRQNVNTFGKFEKNLYAIIAKRVYIFMLDKLKNVLFSTMTAECACEFYDETPAKTDAKFTPKKLEKILQDFYEKFCIAKICFKRRFLKFKNTLFSTVTGYANLLIKIKTICMHSNIIFAKYYRFLMIRFCMHQNASIAVKTKKDIT
jgi:hypothetical protein